MANSLALDTAFSQEILSSLTLDSAFLQEILSSLTLDSVFLQEILSSYERVIWADPVEYFRPVNISGTLEQADAVGLAAWTIEDPTSAITHPKMFDFFETKQEMYYFHRAVESSHIIISNTQLVRDKVCVSLCVFCVCVFVCVCMCVWLCVCV